MTSDPILSVIREHYRLVDEMRWSDLSAFYDNDALYQRGSLPIITGAAAIESFYRTHRFIASGRHTIVNITITSPFADVDGRFSGVLKSGDAVEIVYHDHFEFGPSGQILNRVSTFPGREV